VEFRQVCAACRDEVLGEILTAAPTPAQFKLAIFFGVATAIVCGAAWALAVVRTHYEFGYAAAGVGYAVGWGVVLGSGGKRGRNLQRLSVACAVLGLIVGKYFAFAHAVVMQVDGFQGRSLFDPRLVPIFAFVLRSVLSPFDFLWALLAFRGSWKVPERKAVDVVENRRSE